MFDFFKSKRFDMYLAGPMRGYPGFNEKMFLMAAKSLRKLGFSVWNPADNVMIGDVSFSDCMKLDLGTIIKRCKSIVFLPGWRDSLGANAEAFVAFACGKSGFELQIDNDEVTVMIPVDFVDYKLPYKKGRTKKFDPHQEY